MTHLRGEGEGGCCAKNKIIVFNKEFHLFEAKNIKHCIQYFQSTHLDYFYLLFCITLGYMFRSHGPSSGLPQKKVIMVC
jgi:hypothetical protein